MPSTRTPLPLTAGQEQQVRDIYYKNVRAKCADEIKEFAACAIGRTFTATFMCKQERLKMNNCMIQYANMEEQDRAREEWFRSAEKRIKEREAKEEKKKAQEKFHREWWGLDEKGVIGGAHGPQEISEEAKAGYFPKEKKK